MASSTFRSDEEIAEIYEREVKTIYRVCFTYMKNAVDTEDAVSETFFRLIRSTPVFEGFEHERAWLIRCAINVCRDSLKHSWRKNKDLADYSEVLRAEDSPEISDVADVVFSLPERYRVAIYLYYYEGYTSVQIAQMLKKTNSTIRNHLHEARKILKERLGESYEN